MSKIGVIVDGQGDFHSIRQKFNGNLKVLKTDGPRGHQAKPKDIITKSRKQIKVLKGYKCEKIIILLDFEERLEDYNDFYSQLTEELEKCHFNVDVHIVIVNKMIENWYLADIEYLSEKKKYLKDKIKQKNFEGTHGKKVLKSFFKRQFSYNEVEHGPELFNLVRFEVARQNSSTLDDFLSIAEAN